ncbi:MAG: cobyrinate a,c-diamide synthase [Verrucomicrobiota bacterium]
MNNQPPVKLSAPVAFVVSAPSSGTGKTTVTMGLIAALRKRGLKVQPFKSGPDYIDSAYHSKLAGRPCINLDCWMTPEQFVKETFSRHAHDADVVVVEGVMGLFDGAADGSGSTAQIAKLLDIPILHVINAGKSAQSAAAVLHGMESFDPDLKSIGAIFNNIASSGHWNSVSKTVANGCTAPALGYLPKNPELALPERQLGLLSAFEHGLPDDYIDMLVANIEAHIDIDALLQNAEPRRRGEKDTPEKTSASQRPCVEKTARIGIAKDEAFCFYYQDNLDLLAQAGLELVEFSPVNDQALPADLDGLYFGGGFPEEFSGRLSGNQSMLEAVRNFEGKIIAECGGLIYLCRAFTSLDGTRFPMAGKIDGSIRMTNALQACGYREVVTNENTLLGPAGTVLRGHEFHWSEWEDKPPLGYGAFQTGKHEWGYADETVLASYFHIHFGNSIEPVMHFKRRLKQL